MMRARTDGLTPGFADPTANAQHAFRVLLEAMANPGRVLELNVDLNPPAPLNVAGASACLTLLDFETPLWADLTDAPAAVDWLRFHCGCPLAEDPNSSAFALICSPGDLPPLDRFSMGDDERPERSTTLIVQVNGLRAGEDLILTGPGIDGERRLGVEGLPDRFWRERATLAPLFPAGLDVFLAAGRTLAALPRTTKAAAPSAKRPGE